MASNSKTEATATTRFMNCDYPISYKAWVHLVVYDKKGFFYKSKTDEATVINGRKASVKIAVSPSKAGSIHSQHHIDQKVGSSYTRYIKTKYLRTDF